MNTLRSLLAPVCIALLFTGFGAAVGNAAAPILPVCSWPFESNGQGITNVATPDTNATYWVMPVDFSRWKTMVIQGQYPYARFFNLSTYTAAGGFIDTIYDEKIVPDPRSANPFAKAEVGPNTPGNYTVTLAAANPSSGNFLNTGGNSFAFIVYRVYLPDKTVNRKGGVGLPAVTLTDFSGNSRTLRPCPFANAETSLGNLRLLLQVAGKANAAKFLGQLLQLSKQPLIGTCSPNQSEPAQVTFSSTVPGANFFPNPQTTYFQTANLCYQPGKILVIEGRAPVFPDTYAGGSVFAPAPPFASDSPIQLRYWSMCNNIGVLPYPVVACEVDAMTTLTTFNDSQYQYIYILSNDPAPPDWLPSGVNWLPWGPTSFPITLIFRTILPENSFMQTGDYVPVGAFCSPSQSLEELQGCLNAAGISNP